MSTDHTPNYNAQGVDMKKPMNVVSRDFPEAMTEPQTVAMDRPIAAIRADIYELVGADHPLPGLFANLEAAIERQAADAALAALAETVAELTRAYPGEDGEVRLRLSAKAVLDAIATARKETT